MLKIVLIISMSVAAILFAAAALQKDAPNTQPAVTLKAGDPAPALVPAKWIKGEPVGGFEKGKLYVVDFWATWCVPCRKMIPHLSQLQSNYKDITFIGQDCWEEDDSAVAPFVAQMGDTMNYRVATDDGDHGKMATTWLTAAGQDSIPVVYVIDKETKIAWIGHPLELEPVLKALEAGTFDAKEAAKATALARADDEKIQAAEQTNDPDKVLAVADELSKQSPAAAKNLMGVRYEMLLRKKDIPAAMALAPRIFDAYNDDSEMLNAMAWSMVNPDRPLSNPDLALAEKAASRASELAKGNDPSVLDTLARVYAAQGHLDKAIATESDAVGKASDPDVKSSLSKSLDGFKARQNHPTTAPAQ